MDEPTEQPKKTRGWPKGKKRGPRASRTPSAAPLGLPLVADQFVPPGPTYTKPAPSSEPPEPVSVVATTFSGRDIYITASSFVVQNGRYVFTSYPAQRGYKRITILKADQLTMLAVTCPEQDAEKLTAQPAPAPVQPTFLPLGADAGGAMVPQDSRPIVFGPPLQRPPYSGGDPRRFVRDQNVERASTIPNPPGIPMSEISKGEEGVPETIRATMG